MCLAIYKPAGVEVSEEYLRNGFSNHEDGAGFAWAENGELHVEKGFFDINEVLEQYEKIKQFPCLIHFRKATHGNIDEENCHPFLFNNNKLALIHNGILPIKCETDTKSSDTSIFVRLVLEPMVNKYNIPIDDPALFYLIKTSIGTDKIAIMDGNGKTYIINEDKGTWSNGVWYSNHSYSCEYSSHTVYDYRNQSSGSQARNYDKHKNWEKRVSSYESEDDKAYLEFWARTVKDEAEDSKKSTQLLPVLNNGGQTVDDAGNVIVEAEVVENEKSEKIYRPGEMCEYGWWDEDIEASIEIYMETLGLSRQQALLRSFNHA